ncbi:MAG TPA: RluA family pseudouridine synthase [Clostridia bacterium]|nr:RluA family pseudouridine synthase [Clostridia bacterium]
MRVCKYQVKDKPNTRLDVFLADLEEGFSRSFIKKLINHGMVRVNGVQVKASHRIKLGDIIRVDLPKPIEKTIKPENKKLNIYFEDSDLIVICKPRGMVVHPAGDNYKGTLVNALLYYGCELSQVNGILRPGIVHRLDKDTSGLLVVAKNDDTHNDLTRQLQERSVTRKYLCLAHGSFKVDKGKIDAPIGRNTRDRKKMAVTWHNSKEAVTYYEIMERFGDYTYLRLRLMTGRTHQIRVHLAYIKHPVVGDTKYGPTKPHLNLKGQFLHAAVLGFVHPRTKKYIEFQAPLPVELEAVLNRF